MIGKIMGESKPKGGLSGTCKTFLREWYADEREQIWSKYLQKGNMVEGECIDFMANVLGFGVCEKNQDEPVEDEYFVGSCDVMLNNLIVDVKSVWNRKTLQEAATEIIDSDYEWQGRGYMHLYGKDEFILFYGLLDTPAECNYDNEVIYSDMPENERWVAFHVHKNEELIQQIIDKVERCREWLVQYDALVKSKIGRVND
jgi:hypothetical protein